MTLYSVFVEVPCSIYRTLLLHNQLILKMISREVVGKYKGSVLGLSWSFFNPLLMLGVYTFVFGYIFNGKWHPDSNSRVEFAFALFIGMIVFGLFAECINRAPTLMMANLTYVKKVVFPLKVLPIVSLGVAGFHGLISLIVWLILYLVLYSKIDFVVLYLPILLLPLIFITLGLSWILASVGVFLRDTSQFVQVLTTILMFMSPVFYPISVLPSQAQTILKFNPLGIIMEECRNVLMWQTSPNWPLYSIALICSLVILVVGYIWFEKTKTGFADVL